MCTNSLNNDGPFWVFFEMQHRRTLEFVCLVCDNDACVYIYIRVCVCVCVCVRAHLFNACCHNLHASTFEYVVLLWVSELSCFFFYYIFSILLHKVVSPFMSRRAARSRALCFTGPRTDKLWCCVCWFNTPTGVNYGPTQEPERGRFEVRLSCFNCVHSSKELYGVLWKQV